MGFEDEAEQSLGRLCRQCDGRSKRTYDLTSSIVPRGTSFHRSVEFEFPPIGLDAARFSCCCCGPFSGPAELGAVNPYAVHDHSQPARQGHDRLFHPTAPGDLHRPGLEPGPFLRMQHALSCLVGGDWKRASRNDASDRASATFMKRSTSPTGTVLNVGFPSASRIGRPARSFASTCRNFG